MDGKVLYTIGHGLRHGRFPKGYGVVDKVAVLASVKSMNVRPTNADCCHNLIQENEQLKETNDILIEENSINCELILRFYADFGKETPAELLRRLADIDARRHQVPGTSQGGSHSTDDMHNNDISDEGTNRNEENGDTDYGDDDNDDSDHNDDENGHDVYEANHRYNNNNDDNHGFDE